MFHFFTFLLREEGQFVVDLFEGSGSTLLIGQEILLPKDIIRRQNDLVYDKNSQLVKGM